VDVSRLKTVLVPLDGTPESTRALPLASTLARAADARLHLFRVVPVEIGAASRDAADDLRRLTAELSTVPGLVLDSAVRQGDPFVETVAEVVASKADLVVIATDGRSGRQGALPGSMAERLLQRSPIPVLVQPPGREALMAIKTLLVLLDGSPGGALATGAAAVMAGALHARITLLQVVVPLAFVLARSGADATTALSYYDPGWDEDLLRGTHVYVDGLASRLRRIGINAEGHVSEAQDVLTTIVDTARHLDPDIIVMSTHAHTGAPQATLGSVADGVLRTAMHPVLLVRRTSADH
jgi:nucleotide-binding universal stress UspA family protein